LVNLQIQVGTLVSSVLDSALDFDLAKAIPIYGTYLEYREAIEIFNATAGWLADYSAFIPDVDVPAYDQPVSLFGRLMHIGRTASRMHIYVTDVYDRLARQRTAR
jgi:uncharacterized protein YcsI (UPF0317 family)